MYLPGSVVCYFVGYFDFRAADLRSAFTSPCTWVSTRSLLTLSVPLGLRPLPRPLICAVVFSTALLHSTSGLVGIGSEDICICVCNIVIDIYMFTSRFALCAPRVLLFMRMCHYQQIDLIPCLPLFSSPTCLISPSHISCCRFLGLLLDAR